MQDIRIDGVGKLTGGEFQNVIIDGLGQCDGDIIAKNIDVDGKFKCRGAVTAEVISCDGMAEFYSDIIAKKMMVNGMLTVKTGTKIESDEIYCDGGIRVDGQISADIIEANGYISAKEIVGDKIIIKSRINGFVKFFMKSVSKINLIEATTIYISGVNAQSVNGQNITIGPRCEIETLDCSGTLSIHPTSYVQNITGNYSML